MNRSQVIMWLFFGVALISFSAALIPLLKNEPMNVPFFSLGGLWLIIGISMAARNRRRLNGDGPIQ